MLFIQKYGSGTDVRSNESMQHLRQHVSQQSVMSRKKKSVCIPNRSITFVEKGVLRCI